MKKGLLLFVGLVSLVFVSNAQLVNKRPLFEHFTNTACKCSLINQSFQTQIMKNYTKKIHHVTYHTKDASGSAQDPMYSYNQTPVDDRISYYGNISSPDMLLNGGGEFHGSPAAVTGSIVDQSIGVGTPIELKVQFAKSDTEAKATVTIMAKGFVPQSPKYKLHVYLIESTVTYTTSPGSSGETVFYDVFRKGFTPSGGEAILTPTGNLQMNPKTIKFKSPADNALNKDNLYALAFIQDDQTKEILTSATNLDSALSVTNADLFQSTIELGKKSATLATSTFTFFARNSGSTTEDFILKLDSDQPSAWISNMRIVDQSGNVSIHSSQAPIRLNTVAGNASVNVEVQTKTPGVGKYTLSMKSTTYPNTLTISKEMYIITDIKDLVVNSTSPRSDGIPGSAQAWENTILDGIKTVTNRAAGIDVKGFQILHGTNNALSDVKHLYYNVGWTSPSLSTELIDDFTDFCDNGGNFFMSGFDIAWENLSTGVDTALERKSKLFFTNILHAGFSQDGSQINNKLIRESGDYLYGKIPSMTFNSSFYAAPLYPDELVVLPGADPIFYYTSDKSKIGGIRSLYNNPSGTKRSKIAYFGCGLEVVNEKTARDSILRKTHEWFEGENCYNLTLNISKADPKCYDGQNGVINIKAYGDYQPYTPKWSDGPSTKLVRTDISEGTYTITVTDAGARCSYLNTVIVNQPPAILYNYTIKPAGQSVDNGIIELTVEGGTPPYLYRWSSQHSTAKIENLAPDSYYVTITDANGCTKDGSFLVETSGINDLEGARISIFPNPATNDVVVDVKLNTPSAFALNIYNLVGQKVYHKLYEKTSSTKTPIDLSGFGKGIYIVSLQTSYGTISEKLFVK